MQTITETSHTPGVAGELPEPESLPKHRLLSLDVFRGMTIAGMILVNNAWGESNEKGLSAALAEKGMKPAGIEKFEGSDVDVVPQTETELIKQPSLPAPFCWR